jgi:thiol-disulfide isomerase/thioredoxin
MLRHCSVGIFLVVSVVMTALSAQGAVSAAQLGALNFSLHQRRCPANDMTLTSLQGDAFSLSSLKGKVVILNFWRIDCPPCRLEKPILERIYKRYGDRGLVVVAVNLTDDPSRIALYKRDGGYGFIFAHDPEKRLSLHRSMLEAGLPTTFVVNSKQEAVYEVSAVPTTYVIDREGNIVGHSVGMVHWERGPFSELLESLLAEPAERIAARESVSEPAASTPFISPKVTPASADVGATEAPVPEAEPAVKAETSSGKTRAGTSLKPDKAKSKKRVVRSLKDSVPVAPEPVAAVPQKPPSLPFQGPAATKRPAKRRAAEPKVIPPETKRRTMRRKPRRSPAAGTAPRVRQRTGPPAEETLANRYRVRPYPSTRPPRTSRTAPPRRTGLYPPPPVRPGRDYRTSTPRRAAAGAPQVPSRSVPSERDYRPSSGSRPPVVGPPAVPLGIGGKPSLPPALPYVPSRSRVYSAPRRARDLRSKESTAPRRVEFDKEGYVTARIPGSTGRSRTERVSPTPLRTPGVSDKSRYGTGRIPTDNPIDGFILDSFGNRRPRSSLPIGPQLRETRPRSGSTSLFGSLLDIGTGVKNSLSRIIPLR